MARPDRLASAAILALLLAGCGGGEAVEEVDSVRNETARQAEQIRAQAERIANQAESGVVEIERALENEAALTFENRGNLLNQTEPEPAEPAEP